MIRPALSHLPSSTREAIARCLAQSLAMCDSLASMPACHALIQLCVLSPSPLTAIQQPQANWLEPTHCLPLVQIWHLGASCENSPLLPSCVCYGSSRTGMGCASAGLCPTVQVIVSWLLACPLYTHVVSRNSTLHGHQTGEGKLTGYTPLCTPIFQEERNSFAQPPNSVHVLDYAHIPGHHAPFIE